MYVVEFSSKQDNTSMEDGAYGSKFQLVKLGQRRFYEKQYHPFVFVNVLGPSGPGTLAILAAVSWLRKDRVCISAECRWSGGRVSGLSPKHLIFKMVASRKPHYPNHLYGAAKRLQRSRLLMWAFRRRENAEKNGGRQTICTGSMTTVNSTYMI